MVPPMPEHQTVGLEAKSPFELRVHLGDDVPEQTVREALATGDMGFVHSFTTGSAVDGPVCASWRGPPAACGAAGTATTPTPGP
jgi:hypothetical protein